MLIFSRDSARRQLEAIAYRSVQLAVIPPVAFIVAKSRPRPEIGAFETERNEILRASELISTSDKTAGKKRPFRRHSVGAIRRESTKSSRNGNTETCADYLSVFLAASLGGSSMK